MLYMYNVHIVHPIKYYSFDKTHSDFAELKHFTYDDPDIKLLPQYSLNIQCMTIFDT